MVGCDYHPAFQQIALLGTATGEFGERELTVSVTGGTQGPWPLGKALGSISPDRQSDRWGRVD